MRCFRGPWLLGGLAALVLAGCTGGAPPAPATPAVARAEAGADGAAQAQKGEEKGEEVRVTGSVVYFERIALTSDAVLQVEVVEEGPEGPRVVGQQTVRAPGQAPLRFSVAVRAGRLSPQATYRVTARVEDGPRRFTTPEPVPVLTGGHPREDVRVRVRVGD